MLFVSALCCHSVCFCRGQWALSWSWILWVLTNANNNYMIFFWNRNHSMIMWLCIKWVYIDGTATHSLLLLKNNACCLTYHTKRKKKKAMLCERILSPSQTHALSQSHYYNRISPCVRCYVNIWNMNICYLNICEYLLCEYQYQFCRGPSTKLTVYLMPGVNSTALS